ncbi:MAG: DUF885 domain-containing protein [Gammaproteobacteria bacterium]
MSNIIDRYYRAWFRFYPEAAVDCGVAGYAHLLHPYDDDDLGALTALHEKLLDALDEISISECNTEQCIDIALLRGQALLSLKQLTTWDWRQRDPVRFLPVNAIYQLMVRPVENFDSALRQRLEAIPAYLRGARRHLQSDPGQIPAVWLESGILEAEHGAEYFRQLRSEPRIMRARLEPQLTEAAEVLESFARFLHTEIGPHAAGDFACGEAFFNLSLAQRHFLDCNANALHALGQRLYAETEARLKAVTQQLRGDDNIAAMTATLHQHDLSAETLLTHYQQGMQAAHSFLQQHDLVSLPEPQQLEVVATPDFIRHQIPFAAYMEPVPTDPQQKALYYVTIPDNDEDLREHYPQSIPHTCVHEAWPGHHLQFVTAHLSPSARTWPRLLNSSATLYEGWALYCEQLMQEQGFLAAPEAEFILLKDRLWRTLRIMLDVELHTRGLSLDAAAGRMQAALGMSRQQALADVRWYTRAPTVPMGYATGWALITATRARLQASQPEFSLKAFHDALISAGSIALPLVLRQRFGEPLWSSIHRETFKSS